LGGPLAPRLLRLKRVTSPVRGRIAWLAPPRDAAGQPSRDVRDPEKVLRQRTLCWLYGLSARAVGGWFAVRLKGRPDIHLTMKRPSPNLLTGPSTCCCRSWARADGSRAGHADGRSVPIGPRSPAIKIGLDLPTANTLSGNEVGSTGAKTRLFAASGRRSACWDSSERLALALSRKCVVHGSQPAAAHQSSRNQVMRPILEGSQPYRNSIVQSLGAST